MGGSEGGREKGTEEGGTKKGRKEKLIKKGRNSVNNHVPMALLMRVYCGPTAIVPRIPFYLNFIKRDNEEFEEHGVATW